MSNRDKSYFIHDGQYDMDIVMRKFVEYFYDIYGQNNEGFVEDNGRKLFLLYLKTIINGMGNHYIEAQTRDARRTDIIVDYLDYYHKDKGYLLSSNFNKTKR
jgi:hypothetical protein